VTENEDIVIAITPEEPINEKSAKVKYQMSEEERMRPGVATGKYEIMVKEKKGFFGSAIPTKLPCCVAILFCFLNCVAPGIGTLCSAPFSLCDVKASKKKKVRNFCVNILAGVLQLITAILLVGWLWSILWAIEFLKPLKGESFEDP